MQNQSKKYTLLVGVWVMLLCLAVFTLKVQLPPQITNSTSWLVKKIFEKKRDFAMLKLNMTMPPPELYQQLLHANLNNTPFASAQLIDYHEQLINAMPWLSEAYTVLGFCYYKQGDRAKAFDMFQKSYVINPEFFYNNMALIALLIEAKQFDQANQIINRTLTQNPRISLELMAASKVYQDIFRANPDYNPVSALQQNYETLKNNQLRVRIL